MFLLVSLFVFLAGCGSNNAGNSGASGNEEAAKRIALVLPKEIGSEVFLIQIDNGLKKAGNEFGAVVKTIESADATSSFEQNMRATIGENYDLIITATFEAEDVLKKVATEYPDQAFAIIDSEVGLPNVRGVVFKEYEAAYLLGAAAGLSTKSNVVGIVAAIDAPFITKWTTPFENAMKSVNPEAKLLINYVGSFSDPAKAKEMAYYQHANGADFIAGIAALSHLGVFEAAKEKGFYTSGQDVDQTELAPEQIVLSQLKATDVATYNTVKDFVAGDFTFDTTAYGLKEGGVGLTFVTTESKSQLSPFVGQEVIDQVKAIYEDIVSGTIVVENPLAQ